MHSFPSVDSLRPIYGSAEGNLTMRTLSYEEECFHTPRRDIGAIRIHDQIPQAVIGDAVKQ